MIKAVFFDFDETLQDRTAAFERYMDGFFARFFPGVTGGELEKKKHQMRQSGNGGYVDRVEVQRADCPLALDGRSWGRSAGGTL
mgnify:FL=1